MNDFLERLFAKLLITLSFFLLISAFVCMLAFIGKVVSDCFASDLIPVAIIDTGIQSTSIIKMDICDIKDFTKTGIEDKVGHGTLVAETISKNLSGKYCLMILKWTDSNYSSSNRPLLKAIEYAIKNNAKYINLSLDGKFPNPIEQLLLTLAVNRGIRVIVAAGNEGLDLGKDCNRYPACYNIKDIDVVGAKDRRSNHGGPVNIVMKEFSACGDRICMEGTSFSAAYFTRSLLK